MAANGNAREHGEDLGLPKVTVVLGAQWGDEGKGKVVDMLANDADIVCRCQGGSNADHAVVVNGNKFVFHLIPCGIMNPDCISVTGNGVVIHLPGLFEQIEKYEMKGLKEWKKRLVISDRAHLVFDLHQQIDAYQEGEKGKESLGTTKKGIGPTYSSKVSRNGIRVADLLGDFELFSIKFKSLTKSYQRMYPALEVDVDAEIFRIGGVITGLGLPPKVIGEVVAVVKAYTTRVGSRPFPTELKNKTGKILQQRGAEIGATTNRVRRCGWLDLTLLRYTTMINGYTAICVTKLDVLDTLENFLVGITYTKNGKEIDYFPSSVQELENIKVEYETFHGWCETTENIREFSQLPENAQIYIKRIEEYLEVPVKWIGVGQGRESIINV